MELQIIQDKIYEIRGVRVMLDFDLAGLYQVETRTLKQAVRRNAERFPDDFAFQLTKKEWQELITTCDKFPKGIHHSPVLPTAFTEGGVAMLSSVLRSSVAIQINIGIMRAFAAMRNHILMRAAESVEIVQLRERMLKLEQTADDILEGVNDLSEDLRREIETIYEAIGALSIKLPRAVGESRKIGFKRQKE